ncbi:Clan MA, family M8 [Tritrichomonas foetus]|uniref:Clan MA, family M8 n=1 Tax=Tritrichomonas foetus TaxID=1144522 RepID=A0A1J4JI70_9EUKA|nr:Clan MA, family M8 [Tritrichomonas foetus]|eukprot:OHS97275.1 Clan MA, family M8 [Tritrichomonas foetus]
MIFAIIQIVSATNCFHDSLQSQINIRKLQFPPDPGLMDEDEIIEREPIRIVFDISSLTSDYDPSVCRTIEQAVSWGGREEICTKDDIITPEKISSLNTTLNNVNNYLSSVLNVTRLKGGFDISNITDITVLERHVDCDTFITVTTRPFGTHRSTSLASAFYEITDPVNGRPVQGAIVVNAANIPAEPQNESSFDRIYFTTLLHELVHALGVSYRAIPSWIDPNTNQPYEHLPIIEYSATKYPHKVFRILQTKNVHEFAAERFGVEYFAPDVPAGLELEDGGGVGTFGSHAEARVYIDDMFVGLTIGQNRISKLVFALLADTGWYDVSYEKAEKSAWGLGESLNLSPLTTFPNTAPQHAFPKHYMCDPSDIDTDVCTYDFLGIALCKGVKVDCDLPSDEDDQKFCEMRNFTDPLRIGLRGRSEVHDYLLYKAPYSNSRCSDISRNTDSAYKNGELYGGESLCFMSTLLRSSFSFYTYYHGACHRSICDENGSLIVYVDGIGKICEKANQKLSFSGFKGEIICPEPSYACGIRKFYGIVGPTPVPSPPNPTPIWEGFSLDSNQTIIIAVFASVTGLIIFMAVVMQVRAKKAADAAKEAEEGVGPSMEGKDDPYEAVKPPLVL